MSNTPGAQPTLAQDIDERKVIDYLLQNPGLLASHPDLLSQLEIPHQSGVAVSLVERQLRVLRDENQGLQKKLNELVHIARENEELSQRFHRLSLELMSHDNLHDVIALIRDQIRTFFYTDYVSFYFADQVAQRMDGLEKNVLAPDSKYAGKINAWIEARKPVFGPFEPGIRKQLFNDSGQIPSCVLIPLYHTRNFGMLALGSKSNDRFIDGMGTLFLIQLGDLVSSKLKLYLDRT